MQLEHDGEIHLLAGGDAALIGGECKALRHIVGGKRKDREGRESKQSQGGNGSFDSQIAMRHKSSLDWLCKNGLRYCAA